MQALDWDDLRFVLSLARCRSLAGAARQLAVNESTVGRRVARAEQCLGARLFERTLGSFQATEAGEAVVAGAERIESVLHALAATTSGADRLAAGVVRITSVPMLVNRLLVPALPALLAAHPQLRVELIAEPRDLSLTRRETDLALRLARPGKELGTVARRIGRLEYAVYGPTRRNNRAPTWITYQDAMADLPQCRWMANRISEQGGAAPPLRVNDAEAIISAIKAGMGISLLPVAVGDREPGLRRRETSGPPFSRELWLLTHPDLRDLVRTRVVTDWLAATVARLVGDTPRPPSEPGSRAGTTG